jgi:hypothetical protein
MTNQPVSMREVQLLGRVALLENQVQVERQHADRWQKLAGKYDEIRYELRNCPDTPAGHAEFYHECARLIFGDG